MSVAAPVAPLLHPSFAVLQSPLQESWASQRGSNSSALSSGQQSAAQRMPGCSMRWHQKAGQWQDSVAVDPNQQGIALLHCFWLHTVEQGCTQGQ